MTPPHHTLYSNISALMEPKLLSVEDLQDIVLFLKSANPRWNLDQASVLIVQNILIDTSFIHYSYILPKILTYDRLMFNLSGYQYNLYPKIFFLGLVIIKNCKNIVWI